MCTVCFVLDICPEKLNVSQKKVTYFWNKNNNLYPSTRCICAPIPKICLFFGSHVYIWQQISEVCMNKLPWASVEGRACVHAQEKRNCWLCGFGGLPTTWRNPLKIYTWLSGPASFLSLFVFSWSSKHGFLLCSVQLPREPSGRNFSSRGQTSSKLAHSRSFVESKILRIKRDFMDHEPAVDICGLDPFVLQQNFSKKGLCISAISTCPHPHFPQACPAMFATPTRWNCSIQGFRRSSSHPTGWSFFYSYLFLRHPEAFNTGTSPSSLKYSSF